MGIMNKNFNRKAVLKTVTAAGLATASLCGLVVPANALAVADTSAPAQTVHTQGSISPISSVNSQVWQDGYTSNYDNAPVETVENWESNGWGVDYSDQSFAPTTSLSEYTSHNGQHATTQGIDIDSLNLDSSRLSNPELRNSIVAEALAGQGGNYVWGGKTFKNWDCSGYVSYVFKQNGINLTPYTYTMATELKKTSSPQPGDIVFTNNYAHVGIYLGNGQMISALNPSQGTLVTSVDGGGMMPVDGYYTF